MDTPQLCGDALKAVKHRGSHLQIIACAGSGKTEVVAQRVADLMYDGTLPSAIVAFTFTERAGKELKHRIEKRVEGRLGSVFLDRMNDCFVGTIHSYCFRLLQEHVSKYETFDVLDEHRLAAFLIRVSRTIGLKDLEGQLFKSIQAFTRNIDVVENELISLDQLAPPFRDIATAFYTELENYRFLTYGQVITRVVQELKDPEVFKSVHNSLKHLIVDEYQDINPAQEALIGRLAAAPVELCVVGDDDQSIYQWRGSDVNNIVTFKQRYPNVETYEIVTNRRSRPEIITTANHFAKTIVGRLEKEMETFREGFKQEVVYWREETEADEADRIAKTIDCLVKKGFRYKDVAVLVRASTSYDRLLEAFGEYRIPVQPAGRTGLFHEPEAQLFGRTFAFLAGHEWRAATYGRGEEVLLDNLIEEYSRKFDLDSYKRKQVAKKLSAWKAEVTTSSEPADLVGDYYDLLTNCGVAEWDFHIPDAINRLGTLARCSAILADYESTHRRARPDPDSDGEMKGGQDRGEWYYKWLAIYIQNWAHGAFEAFDGEEAITLDAVDLTTVHQAKGLEWPIVFVPCVSAKRFPSSKTGQKQKWHVSTEHFNHGRYEGTENDERRLFYVALSRARDWLSISTHNTPNRQRVPPSPFLTHVCDGELTTAGKLQLPNPPEGKSVEDDLLHITFSELADFKSCGLAYRLRNLIGFQPPLAPELGYGKAVHHILRNVAEYTRRNKRPPPPEQLDLIFDQDFYLPAANKPAYRQMKEAARRLVDRYVDSYGEDLNRVWAVERPFELHLPTVVISGRADVILEEKDGQLSSMSIVDYKTAADDPNAFDRQLQIYTDAGRREGLNVSNAYIHDLQSGDRISVDVEPTSIKDAESEVISIVDQLRSRNFVPQPGEHCRNCDVRPMCKDALS